MSFSPICRRNNASRFSTGNMRGPSRRATRIFFPRSKLEAYLPKISKQGYATTHGNVNANFVAIASPVFDHTGGIAGVLTILGPDKYLRGQEHEASIKSLTAAAAQLSKRMGAAPGA